MYQPKIPTKTIEKNFYKNYLIKAEQFLATMRNALLEKNWNAVGLNAVHAAISANDALSVYYHGLRCVSDKHTDAISLLTSLFKDKEVGRNASHLSWLISRKNLVEYETRLFFEKEAKEAAKHAERFISWVKSKLPD